MKTSFRVETINGRHLLCGGIIPGDMVTPGQRWAAADGSDREVTVVAGGDSVVYVWTEAGQERTHTKLNFSFQTRYCLILDRPTVPSQLGSTQL